MIPRASVNAMERAADGKSLSALLRTVQTNKIRDPYIYFDWDDAGNNRFQAGYSLIYPGCRTGGHEHDDAVEVYFVISGNGVMHVGEEAFEVSPGDSWVVPLHEHHWTDNPCNRPLEMYWIVVKL